METSRKTLKIQLLTGVYDPVASCLLTSHQFSLTVFEDCITKKASSGPPYFVLSKPCTCLVCKR